MGEEEHKLGIRASSTRQVFFNDCVVPVENMLAGRGEGFKIAMNALNVGRIKLAAACLDSQRRILTDRCANMLTKVNNLKLLFQILELLK